MPSGDEAHGVFLLFGCCRHIIRATAMRCFENELIPIGGIGYSVYILRARIACLEQDKRADQSALGEGSAEIIDGHLQTRQANFWGHPEPLLQSACEMRLVCKTARRRGISETGGRLHCLGGAEQLQPLQ